jgi:hypothetical protein
MRGLTILNTIRYQTPDAHLLSPWRESEFAGSQLCRLLKNLSGGRRGFQPLHKSCETRGLQPRKEVSEATFAHDSSVSLRRSIAAKAQFTRNFDFGHRQLHLPRQPS